MVVFDNGQLLSHVAGLIDLFHSGGVILTVVVLVLLRLRDGAHRLLMDLAGPGTSVAPREFLAVVTRIAFHPAT